MRFEITYQHGRGFLLTDLRKSVVYGPYETKGVAIWHKADKQRAAKREKGAR